MDLVLCTQAYRRGSPLAGVHHIGAVSKMIPWTHLSLRPCRTPEAFQPPLSLYIISGHSAARASAAGVVGPLNGKPWALPLGPHHEAGKTEALWEWGKS